MADKSKSDCSKDEKIVTDDVKLEVMKPLSPRSSKVSVAEEIAKS